MGNQLTDDLDLFESMQSGHDNSASIYQPGNYWAKYYQETVRVIREEGLHDFRRQPWGYFRSFGAADFSTTTEFQRLYLDRSNIVSDKQEMVLDYLDFIHANRDLPLLPYNISCNDLDHMAARTAEVEGILNGAESLLDIEPDTVGNFFHLIDYKGRTYSHFFLQYYMRYAYVAKFIDFTKIDNIVEIGSGSGNQVEILKKFYPHINFYLLDMPPYLYVCHQFLHHVFPDHCLDFRETEGLPSITATECGQILFLGNWQISNINPCGTTLFWNSASFGEMEPDIVAHYINNLRPWSDGVYLYQCMGGKEIGEIGKGGVLKQTKMSHYKDNLGSEFQLIDCAPSYQPMQLEQSSGGYDDAIWVRAGGKRILRSPMSD